jgi:beta-aspartyl-dipeptidase (metallo-type)
MQVVDCRGKLICPGFIDQHVHILGGGGEEGPVSRIPEICLSDLTTAGVCTLVGVLGIDSMTRISESFWPRPGPSRLKE